MMVECLDGFESRANDLNDFVLAMVDQRCEARPNTFLIVGNENAHAWEAELFMPQCEVVLGMRFLFRSPKLKSCEEGRNCLLPLENQRRRTAVTAIRPPKQTSTSQPGLR